MTETTVLLSARELVGSTIATAFTEQSPLSPYSADRLAVVNPATGRVVMVARDESRGAPAIADISHVMTPALTQARVSGKFLFTMADWTTAANGQLRKYISASLQTPILVVDDSAAAGPLAVVDDGTVPVVVVHGRSRGAMLVARSFDALAEIATVLLPAPPLLICADGTRLYVFCKNQRAVEVVDWNAALNRFEVGQPLMVPMAAQAIDAVFDGSRLVVVAPAHIVVFDLDTESAVLVHHDNHIGFASVDSAIVLGNGDFTDGVSDPDYVAALWHARFNPGKDRSRRDYYVSAEQLSRVASVVGTEQTPVDGVTNRLRQRYVRKVGERWMVLDGRTGRLALSGDLVWRFRGANAAENPKLYAYDEPDAASGKQVSTESAIRSRMVWENGVQFAKTASGDRYAYLDGTTDARFGSVKTVFLPTVATVTCWIRPQSRGVGQTHTLLAQAISGMPSIALYDTGGVASAIYRGFSAPGLAVFDDAWHFLALVINTGSMDFYLDGVLVGTTPIVQAWTPSAPGSSALGDSLFLGRRPDDVSPHRYKGWLGDCRIYKLAATADFIAALAGLGPHGPSGGGGTIVSNALLLETGDSLLLETSDALLLE